MAKITKTDYEPESRIASRLIAQREFLLMAAEHKSQIVEKLFQIAFPTFIALASHRVSLGFDSLSFIEVMSFGELKNDVFDTEIEDICAESAPEYSAERARLRAELRQKIEAWGQPFGLNADWCYEFGYQVLVARWRPSSLIVSEKARPQGPAPLAAANQSEAKAKTSVVRVQRQKFLRPPPIAGSSPMARSLTLQQHACWEMAADGLMQSAKGELRPVHKKVKELIRVGFHRWHPVYPPPPPSPPLGFSPYDGSYPVENYLNAQIGMAERELLIGIMRHLSDNVRKACLKNFRGVLEGYCRLVDQYQLDNGMVEVKDRKEFQRDLEWTVRARCCGEPIDALAKEEAEKNKSSYKSGTSYGRITEAKARIEAGVRQTLVDLGLPAKPTFGEKKRGRKPKN